MTAPPDVFISVAAGLDPGMADDLLIAAQQQDLATAHEEREPEAYAGAEWLLPTAVTLWLAEKYFGRMLEEAGKSHYDSLRSAWRRLLRRTTGPEREIRSIAVVSRSSPNKITEPDLPVLSVYCALRTGQRVKFVFEHVLTEENQAVAIQSMHQQIARHYRSPDGGDLAADLAIQGVAHDRMVVLRFDATQSRWQVWHPRSARE